MSSPNPCHNDQSPVLPSPSTLAASRSQLLQHLPTTGLGNTETQDHLTNTIAPALNASSSSPHYYGFVTGGSTPIAAFADNLVTKHDQNVQVHLPHETIATDVEAAALQMVCEMIDPVGIAGEDSRWHHRTFTTGATASNVLGLVLGREWVVQQAGFRLHGAKGTDSCSVAEDGIVRAMQHADLDDIQIPTTVAHSSLKKAASIAGLGRSCIIDIGCSDTPDVQHRPDLAKLEQALQKPRTASIIVISCAEVNTGLFATDAALLASIARLAKQHAAWIHVDAAFGLTAALLPPTPEFAYVRRGVADLHLADSITGDAHKMLNVPYDCGVFLSQHLALATHVLQNPNAAYLNTASTETTTSTDRNVPSPLNIGLENSRRFRALPVYASLAALGRDGYGDMIVRQVRLARSIAGYVASNAAFELLAMPGDGGGHELENGDAVRETKKQDTAQQLNKQDDSPCPQPENSFPHIYNIVLFRAVDVTLNAQLTRRINATRKIYVSGTRWGDQPATRFAIANWQVDVERDLEVVRGVLEGVCGREA